MTPKEKAKELVDKFISYSYFSDGNNSMNRANEQEDNAKECALIAVDEITSIKLLWYQKDTKELEYWKEVKQEINKL